MEKTFLSLIAVIGTFILISFASTWKGDDSSENVQPEGIDWNFTSNPDTFDNHAPWLENHRYNLVDQDNSASLNIMHYQYSRNNGFVDLTTLEVPPPSYRTENMMFASVNP